MVRTGTTITPFLYNGQDGVMTDQNGLYYMRARYYNPDIKRFINQDILLGDINNGQSLNRYAYVNGNPIIMADPQGRFAWIIAGTVVGGVIGGGLQVVSNLTQGKGWYKGVAGATIGGAISGGILAATGGTSLLAMGGAALAGGTAQALMNEGEKYVLGEEPINQNNLLNSVENIGINTLEYTGMNFAGNYVGAKFIPINSGWFKPQSWKSFLTKSYGQKIILQTGAGSGLSFLESELEDDFDKLNQLK